MRTLLTTLFIMVAMITYAKEIKVSGYILNTKGKTSIEVTSKGKVVYKKDVRSLYKLKLEQGAYLIKFKSGNVEKKMFIVIKKNYNVQIDVDFRSKYNVILDNMGTKQSYSRSYDKNFEKIIAKKLQERK